MNKSQKLEQNLTQLNLELQCLKQQKSEREQVLRQLELDIAKSRQIQDLDKELAFLQLQRDRLKQELVLLQTTQADVFSQSMPKLKQKLVELSSFIHLLQGDYAANANQNLDSINIQAINHYQLSAHEYVDEVKMYLAQECGRHYSFEQLANLLVCIQLNFLTILAGSPGTGKTSLIYYLSEALGIEKQLLKISVAKGWGSQADLLGLFNPLKGEFQSATTGLYEFLQKNNSDFHAWVLLDEANLSPMEHYWSSFLGFCDPEGQGQPLDLGINNEQRYLPIGNNLRFIATVNMDHTTEMLSPRLLDRVPVIYFDKIDYSLIGQINHYRLAREKALPFSKTMTFFGEGASLSSQQQQNLQQIFQHLPKHLSLSARKYYKIQHYYQVANRLLDDANALDFAIAQFILPVIQGQGQTFKQQLQILTEFTTQHNYQHSTKLLANIINHGEQNYDSYNFFDLL